MDFDFDSSEFKSHQSPRRDKSHVPVEIWSEVFLYLVNDHFYYSRPSSHMDLKLVCRRWRDIMLSTPGIHSQLPIRRKTEEDHVKAFIQGRSLLDVIVTMGFRSRKCFPRPIFPDRFYAAFMVAAHVASRWRSLVLDSLPPPGEYRDLQIVQPLQRLESFKLARGCNLGNFLEPLMTAITTTVTKRFTVMEVFHPDAALYLVQPAHLQIFSSLTTLRLLCTRMQNPVDILTSLHKLETFEAHHLFLPIYPPNVDLPLTQTLRVLHLKSVSVQWMEDQIFPVLQDCSITFPHHADAIQSVHMPSCSILKYDSNDLVALEYFHLSHPTRLKVKSGQCRTWRGNLQLTALHPIFAARSLTHLDLEIKCSEQLLAYMLGLVPTLQELWMGLSNPHALSRAFFLAFAAGGRNAGAMAGSSSRTVAPLCRELKRLHLHYKRWLRGLERKDLIPTFGDVVASRRPFKESRFSLCLSFDEGPYMLWRVHEPVESFDICDVFTEIHIGFSSPHGIVRLSTNIGGTANYFQQFRELEYITIVQRMGHENLPIHYFFPFHSLREVRAPTLFLDIWHKTRFPSNLLFFHTLKVLDVGFIPSSFLAGQTFQKLERYKEQIYRHGHDPGHVLLTEMPVCTKLVVRLSRLATLKLPQIRELGVEISGVGSNNIWEMHVAVNANLSGLKLLHLWNTSYSHEQYIGDTIKILRSLPALETLVIDEKYLVVPHVNFFGAFVPMDAQGTSGQNQSCWEGRILRVVCPRLASLQIEGSSLTKQPGLMPILKDIVTLRAIIGSPLKSFTFYDWRPEKKWELIGTDRSFIMEEVVPAQRFQIDI